MTQTGTTRRSLLIGLATSAIRAAQRPAGILIDTHIHLFASDQARFPYHRNATYKPPAEPLESYIDFIRQSRIDHAIIVHPEPYQDDHRYLEYCFEHEPSRGFFKGTCLFDPLAAETPARMAALVKKHPGRIVALRVHETQDAKLPPSTGPAIRDRDLQSPAMLTTWKKAHELGLAIQMHFIPGYAQRIRALASQLKEMPVILDHLGRAGQGTPAEYDEVLRLAELPRVFMKFSGVNYSSKEKHPFRDVQPIVRRIYQAFGPDRIIWGGLGMNMTQFQQQIEVFDQMFAFAPEAERVRIRGRNAQKLYRF
jgi:predicted TIM-barrel fold metal-dependent hydrolase